MFTVSLSSMTLEKKNHQQTLAIWAYDRTVTQNLRIIITVSVLSHLKHTAAWWSIYLARDGPFMTLTLIASGLLL